MRSPREPRVPPANSPAHVHTELEGKRTHLDALRRHHLELVRRFLAAADGAIFSIDMFLSGVATRSYHLVDGFLALFDEWNVISAAPILRLQLDNLTRVSYVVHAPQSDVV